MRIRHGAGKRTPRVIGIITVFGLLGALIGVYQVDRVGSFVKSLSADSITAEFDGVRGSKLAVGGEVKVADAVIGQVDGVEQSGHGTTVATLRLDEYQAERLGSRPRAQLRATTLLGGKYYVDLQPGGHGAGLSGMTIPVRDTGVPVELDEVLRAVPPPAQSGLRTASRQLDRTLHEGGREALQRTFTEAPGTLRPAGELMSALQGNSSGHDLTTLVSKTNAIAEVLTEKDGQLGEVVDSTADISSALADEREALSGVTADLPETLKRTDSGMRSLEGTLARLSSTAEDVRPAVAELGPLVDQVDVLSREARPVVSDLVPVLKKARPVVDQLVPTAGQATRTLDNVRGPVLDRVRGPIVGQVTSPWHGTGGFKGNGNDHKMYEEVGYLAARGANLSHYTDHNSQLIALALGVGTDAVGGIDPLGLGALTSNLLGENPPPATEQQHRGGPPAPDVPKPLLPLPGLGAQSPSTPNSQGPR